jgi:hypothetical protein
MPTNIKMPLSDVSLYQPVDAEDNDASSGFLLPAASDPHAGGEDGAIV